VNEIAARVICFVLVHSAMAFALEHVPSRHVEEQFRIEGDPRTFSRHVFIPVDHEQEASPESRELLAIVAGEIWDQADQAGYTAGHSGHSYRQELVTALFLAILVCLPALAGKAEVPTPKGRACGRRSSLPRHHKILLPCFPIQMYLARTPPKTLLSTRSSSEQRPSRI
jgi:hypothetical protein